MQLTTTRSLVVRISYCQEGDIFSICFSYGMFLLDFLKVIRLRLKCDGTRAETRFRLSAKRTSPFKSAGGRQFSRLLAAEVCASAVVMLDTPCSEVVVKSTGYPLHSPVSPSLPLPCVTVCHHISTGLYHCESSAGCLHRPIPL
jgi:hypothetical protein